jgi:hypothetical protein
MSETTEKKTKTVAAAVTPSLHRKIKWAAFCEDRSPAELLRELAKEEFDDIEVPEDMIKQLDW